MNNLEKLKQVKACYIRLQMAKDLYERWKARAESVTGIIDEIKVQNGNSANKTEDIWISSIAVKDYFERTMREYMEALNTANNILFSLENPLEMEIAYKRHIEGLPWTQIACDLGYSERRCLQINRGMCARLAMENE